MEKHSDENVFFHHRRKAMFSKTLRKRKFGNDEQHHQNHLSQAKTVKALHREEERIPPLNVSGLKHYFRQPFESLEEMGKEKYEREKLKASKKIKNLREFLINPEQNMLCQNFQNSSNQTIKKLSIFPEIIHHKLSSSHDPLKKSNVPKNSSFSKKKPTKINVHCKILLIKNSHFPLIGFNHEQKMSDEMRTKQRIEEMKSPFRLDLSQINERKEPVSPLFFSKESLQEIVVF